MKREIQITADGSTSIFIPELNEGYHSKHGAIQEAYHVFIKNGLDTIKTNQIHILEIGFGTGLNAFITYLEALQNNQKINYVGVEAYPVTDEHIQQMNYVQQLNAMQHQAIYTQMHTQNWELKHPISEYFELTKRNQLFQDITDQNTYNLIYFDAFGFTAQPELWTEEIFKTMYNALQKDGILVTYACRTSIKKAMQSAGFAIEKLPGAPGKREMLRATKK